MANIIRQLIGFMRGDFQLLLGKAFKEKLIKYDKAILVVVGIAILYASIPLGAIVVCYTIAVVIFFFWLFSAFCQEAKKERKNKIILSRSKVIKCDQCGEFLYNNLGEKQISLSDKCAWFTFCRLEKGCSNFRRKARGCTSLVDFVHCMPIFWTDEYLPTEGSAEIKIIHLKVSISIRRPSMAPFLFQHAVVIASQLTKGESSIPR